MTACTRCQTALEDGDLRCAICALPVLIAALDPGARPDGAPRAQILRCGECGAAIAFSPEARAPRCGFCAAVMAIEQPVDPVEAARLRVPFAVDRAEAEAALRGWLGSRGWFAPPALAGDAVLESLTPLAWAAWLVNAEARVAWTADSDAGAQRSAWAPHAGEASLAFRDIVVPASRGLREVEARLLIPYYDLRRAVPVDRDLEGEPVAMIERFDAQRSAARRHVQERIDALARGRIEPRIPGRRYRNVRVACLLERQTTERIALPAWILAYRYRGHPYRAIVHGQRAEVVFGRAPIDWGKVGWLVVIAAAAVLAALLIWFALR
ncbi:MAG TPA: hypothetical protein VHW23_11925 [Kofleriaceae bacterium]|jgi:hypothetical protein|nr:hypothetical protein [Kofleriaceae bacterium]